MNFGKREKGLPPQSRLRLATGSGEKELESKFATMRTMEHAFSMFHNTVLSGVGPSNIEIDRLAQALYSVDLTENGDGACGNLTARLTDLFAGAVARRRSQLGAATCAEISRYSDLIVSRAERSVRLRLAKPASATTTSSVVSSIGLQRVARSI